MIGIRKKILVLFGYLFVAFIIGTFIFIISGKSVYLELLIIIFGANTVLVMDQYLRLYLIHTLKERGDIKIIPEIFSLQNTKNISLLLLFCIIFLSVYIFIKQIIYDLSNVLIMISIIVWFQIFISPSLNTKHKQDSTKQEKDNSLLKRAKDMFFLNAINEFFSEVNNEKICKLILFLFFVIGISILSLINLRLDQIFALILTGTFIYILKKLAEFITFRIHQRFGIIKKDEIQIFSLSNTSKELNEQNLSEKMNYTIISIIFWLFAFFIGFFILLQLKELSSIDLVNIIIFIFLVYFHEKFGENETMSTKQKDELKQGEE